MWGVFLLSILCLSLIKEYEASDNRQIRIPLLRQKSLREQLAFYPSVVRSEIDNELPNQMDQYDAINDSIALLRYLDAEIYANVQIGHPPQNFKVLFDTAWHTSWVVSNECSYFTWGCYFHKKYNHKKSKTYRPNGIKYYVDEGNYNYLSGYYSNDTFLIGNSRVDGQLFVEMTYVPTSYFYYKSDGIMGLGFKQDQFNPFLYNMFENKSIDKLLFSIYISRDQDSDSAGDISLGFINEEHIRREVVPGANSTSPEPITYLPVNPLRGYWEFQMDKIIVNVANQNVSSQFCMNGCVAIIGSTSNTIIGPESEIKAINKLVGAKKGSDGRNYVECGNIDSLPAITVVLAGKNFTIDASNYIFKITSTYSTKCVTAFTAPSAPGEENMWILGGAFLSQFYSIYDMDKLRIGFVTAA